MHIVQLNDDRVPTAKGGSALVAEWERQELVRRGQKVTLVTTHQDGKEMQKWNDETGDIISIPVNYPLQQRHRKCVRMKAVSKVLDEILTELQPDIVHAHTIHMYLTYDALRIAAKHTSRVFMTAHDTHAVAFGRVNSERYRNDALAQRTHRLQVCDHLHAVGRRYWPLRNGTIRRAIRESETQIIAISEDLRKFLEGNGIPCAAVVYNGIPLQNTDKVPNEKSRPTILYGGRINADKGIGVLLKAMEQVCAEIPDVQLLVVGEEERLQPHLVQAPKVVRNAVHCTGWVPYEEMFALYATADVVTTPSIYLDAFNLMNIEAMQAGKPVVGTCFGGTPEIVVNGITGIVCNPSDTKEYATALLTVLQDSALAQKMGTAGRCKVEETFSMREHGNALVSLFESDEAHTPVRPV
jgi:glycosyltransferase involved in cell wall biosynthesis